VLKTDPYLLVREIPGFGFKRVDVVARKMGTPKDHPSRIRAGVVAEIDDAVAHAEASPLPAPQDALADLFASYPWSR